MKKLTVNFAETSQDLEFDEDILSVDGQCCRKKYLMGNKCFFIGALSAFVLLIIWAFLTNHHLCDYDEHTKISLQAYYQLEFQGISWDVEKGIWVIGQSPSP